MEAPRLLLLTGATGLLGRFVLRDVLQQDDRCRIVLLVRSTSAQPARERVEAILDHWQLPATAQQRVTVLEGELPDYAPGFAERRWLAKCDTVIHAAASLNFRPTTAGEPQRTNVEGTRRLLGLITAPHWIQISTAYVAGNTTRRVLEDDDGPVAPPRNSYERSKRVAEQLVRHDCKGPRTIIRPGILVGDSETGYTSNYQGVYWLFRAVSRLASRVTPGGGGLRRLPVRLALRGDERKHLVPVNWASQAIVQLLHRSAARGRTIHLVPGKPMRTAVIRDAIQEAFGICGIEFTGCKQLPSSRNIFERMFERETALIDDYLCDDPPFDRRNLDEILPAFPSPRVDAALIRRLIAFAESDNWGEHAPPAEAAPFPCEEFFERHFPTSARQWSRERIANLNAVVRFVVRGAGGGIWSCRLEKGDVAEMTAGGSAPADFEFVTETSTLRDIIRGRVSTREAFFARRIEIHGDIERALVMALLFEDLLAEFPFPETVPQSAAEAAQEVLSA